MIFTRKSLLTGKMRTKDLSVTQEQYESWKGGSLIQNAMAHLTPSEREFIITGLDEEEWQNMLEEEE